MSDTERTAYRAGDQVGCHRGLFERPGTILGPGRWPDTYCVAIVNLGMMDVHTDSLRTIASMSDVDQARMEALRQQQEP